MIEEGIGPNLREWNPTRYHCAIRSPSMYLTNCVYIYMIYSWGAQTDKICQNTNRQKYTKHNLALQHSTPVLQHNTSITQHPARQRQPLQRSPTTPAHMYNASVLHRQREKGASAPVSTTQHLHYTTTAPATSHTLRQRPTSSA